MRDRKQMRAAGKKCLTEEWQDDILEKAFKRNPKPTPDQMEGLIKGTRLDKESIWKWFNNRRKPAKRAAAKASERAGILEQSSNSFTCEPHQSYQPPSYEERPSSLTSPLIELCSPLSETPINVAEDALRLVWLNEQHQDDPETQTRPQAWMRDILAEMTSILEKDQRATSKRISELVERRARAHQSQSEELTRTLQEQLASRENDTAVAGERLAEALKLNETAQARVAWLQFELRQAQEQVDVKNAELSRQFESHKQQVQALELEKRHWEGQYNRERHRVGGKVKDAMQKLISHLQQDSNPDLNAVPGEAKLEMSDLTAREPSDITENMEICSA